MSDEPKPADDATPERDAAREDAPEPGASDAEGPGDAAPPEGADVAEPSDGESHEQAPAAEEAPSGEEAPPAERQDEAEAEEAEEEETKDMAPAAATEERPPGGEEAAAEAPGGEPEGRPHEEPPPPPPPQYDGLDSGLAWFGQQPFVPLAPAGYVLAEAAAEAVAPPAEGLAARKQRVRERFEARRKEVEAARKWYQRIPIPILVSLPAAIFIVVWILFVAPPWRRIPDPSEKLDPSLLEAEPLEDQGEKLRALKVVSSSPLFCWDVLPGDVLRMDALRQAAHVTLQPPEKPSGFELTCDACIVEENGRGYMVTLLLDDVQGISLQGNQFSKRVRGGQERAKTGVLQAVRVGATTGAQWSEERPLKLGYWYRMRVVVEPESSRFYLNGRKVTEGGRQRANVRFEPSVRVSNARVLVRNLGVKPIE